MKLEVKPPDVPGLCGKCEYAQSLTVKDKGTRVRCKALGFTLDTRSPITHCSEFRDETVPRVDFDAGWDLITTPDGTVLGFEKLPKMFGQAVVPSRLLLEWAERRKQSEPDAAVQ